MERLKGNRIIMKNLINKAEILIEALPYIQKFRGAVVVIKLGGSAMEDKNVVSRLLTDITFMECVGMTPIIVHGGGKAISRGMREEGIDSKFLHGLRVTCEKSIEVVERVIKGEVNPSITKVLADMGATVSALHGEDIFKVTRKVGNDKNTGEALDWGFVGEPSAVSVEPIKKLIDKGIIPVITPLGVGADNKIHNINADVAAGAVAKALKARKLVYLTDVPGLLRDPSDPESLIATLRLSEIEYLVDTEVISGGMLPKVSSGVEALKAGVKKVHMIDGRMQHSLLLEIFTDSGVGTELVPD